MSTLFEQGGVVSLDWNAGEGLYYALSVNAKHDAATLSGVGFVVAITIPSVAVARKLAELFDRYAELRELSTCAHAYLDDGDWCAVCGKQLDYRAGIGGASK